MMLEKLINIRNLLERVQIRGTMNMMTLCTAVADLNEIISKLEGKEDVSD